MPKIFVSFLLIFLERIFYVSAPGAFPAFSYIRFNGNNMSRVPGGGGSSYLVYSSAGAGRMVVIHY